jgi:hypothetical protein
MQGLSRFLCFHGGGQFLVPLALCRGAWAGHEACTVRPRELSLGRAVRMPGSCRKGPANGLQMVEMCGNKSPSAEAVSVMSGIKNANDGHDVAAPSDWGSHGLSVALRPVYV